MSRLEKYTGQNYGGPRTKDDSLGGSRTLVSFTSKTGTSPTSSHCNTEIDEQMNTLRTENLSPLCLHRGNRKAKMRIDWASEAHVRVPGKMPGFKSLNRIMLRFHLERSFGNCGERYGSCAWIGTPVMVFLHRIPES